MENKKKSADAADCVHCHICQKNCEFLSKYKIDIGDSEELKKLSYHCFLCGTCTRVCPKGIDGRQIILNMRREAADLSGGQPKEKGYRMLLAEKKDYLFKNYRHVTKKSVFFPGCNFPSFYPATTKKLVKLLKDEAGIGVVYDCCGKPVAELGMQEQEERIIRRLSERLEKNGVTEVITACPNCFHFLKPRLAIQVTDIYEKLGELGIGSKITGGSPVFLPCPDREDKDILENICTFMAQDCSIVNEVQCCGLGGCAGAKEADLAQNMAEKISETAGDKVYTYCASCSGNLKRNGCKDARHVLTEILETYEEPDTGKSMLNRIKTKLR